ncbi:MAG TPA: META domain-containing protein [Actinomycetota bacterium]|nr:META domain-containing protein [Actinomycetota bacterium]
MTRRLVALLTVALLAVSCGGSDEPARGPQGPDVDASGVWRLESGHAPAGHIDVAPEWRMTFEVDGRDVHGSAGCNSYAGGISIDGDRFDAGSFAVSEIGCPPEIAEAEERFLDALDDADTIAVEGATLTLTGPDTELVFRRVPPVKTKPLTRTAWVLDGLLEGSLASSTVASAEPARLRLSDDETLEGTTGCRSFSGSWTTSGDVVTITGMSFEGTCHGAVAQQDAHVITVLGGGFRTEVDGARLTLTAARGRLGLVYRAQ